MISVIMPTFNRERCIEKSVRTVLEQSVTDLELIVVDDGSSDSTRSIIEGIGDSRLHYIYQENAGACVARNRGIAAASGEYLAFQDSDDLWDKDKLKKQIAVLEANEQVDIVCCRTRLRQLDGSLLVTAKNHEEGFVDLTKGPVGFSTQTLVMRRTFSFRPCQPALHSTVWKNPWWKGQTVRIRSRIIRAECMTWRNILNRNTGTSCPQRETFYPAFFLRFCWKAPMRRRAGTKRTGILCRKPMRLTLP